MNKLCAVLLMLCANAVWADAFTDGKNFGNDNKQGAYDIVNQSTASELPYYNTNPAEASLVNQASGLFNSAVGRQTECAPSTDKSMPGQNCQAVNFLANNPSSRVKFDITGQDPVFSAARSIQADPNSIVNLNGEMGECVLKDIPSQDLTEIVTCTDFLQNSENICYIGRNVTITPEYLYQCDKTLQSEEEQSCHKVLAVAVESTIGCEPGQLLSRYWINTCPQCLDPYMHTEVVCGTGNSYDVRVYSAAKVNTSFEKRYWLAGRNTVVGAAGTSFDWVFIDDNGMGCKYPVYFKQTCNQTSCVVETQKTGNQCNGKPFQMSATVPIPLITTTVDTWDDQCSALAARATP